MAAIGQATFNAAGKALRIAAGMLGWRRSIRQRDGDTAPLMEQAMPDPITLEIFTDYV